eukprot:33612-Pelagomonas_calceolata.AAC.1
MTSACEEWCAVFHSSILCLCALRRTLHPYAIHAYAPYVKALSQSSLACQDGVYNLDGLWDALVLVSFRRSSACIALGPELLDSFLE